LVQEAAAGLRFKASMSRCPGSLPPAALGRYRGFLRLLAVVLAGLGGVAELPGQELAGWTTSQLQQQAQAAVERQQYGEAVPALAELDRRFRGSAEPALVKAREGVLYFLGVGRLHAEDYAGAAENLREFVDQYGSARQAPFARLFLGDAWFAQARWPEARAVYDALGRDAVALGALDAAQQLALWDRLSDCCFAAQDWADGPDVFRALQAAAARQVDGRLGADKRAKAGAYLLQAAIGRGELETALAALAVIGASGGEVRYDLSLNLALVRGGDAWYERGSHAEALHFYERVLPPAELQRYWQDVGRRAAVVQPWEELQGGKRRNVERVELAARARQRQEQIETAIADGTADYAAALAFRIARCYLALERTYEAYWAFDRLQQAVVSGAEGWAEEAWYGLVVAAVGNGQSDRVRRAARAYLDVPEYRRFLGEIVHEVIQSEQRAGRAAELDPWWRELLPRLPGPPGLVAAPRIVLEIGSSWLGREQLPLLKDCFQPLVDLTPTPSFADGLHYWLGLAAVYEGAFASALKHFEWVTRAGVGAYAEDAAFRIGVCRFGLLQYEEAQRVLTQFLQDFPRSRLVSEAQALSGDLAAAEGRIEGALASYRAAEAAGAEIEPPHLSYINHAVFQGARLLAANQRWEEMVSWLQSYIDRWGREGRLSDALYELGRAQTALGRRQEAVDGWFEAIVRFGDDVRDDGPDLMLREYPKNYYEVAGRWPVEVLQSALAAARARSAPSLALRLHEALRLLGAGEVDGPEDEAWDPGLASAAVLVHRARRLAVTDLAAALGAVEEALVRQPAAPIWEDALHLAGQLRLENADVVGALAAYQEAAARFPASPRAAVARLREGDLLRRSGRPGEAIAAYRAVLQTRQWRGAPWAEANFKIGLTHLEAGEMKEAFGFSQRVYVLYGSVAEWAAPAYVQSGLALEGLGRMEDAAATYRELLGREDLRDTPSGREAAERLASLR
jgi:TolA-binding protein